VACGCQLYPPSRAFQQPRTGLALKH
jgi:hypothetical protein